MMQSRLGRVASALVAVSLLFAAAPAAAADQPEDDEDAPGGPLGEKLEDYWSVDRDVEVVKQQLHERSGRFSVGLHTGMMSSQPFFWYLPSGLDLEFNVSNNWAIAAEGSFMDAPNILRHPTDLTDFVDENQGDGFDATRDALDTFVWRAHALAVWRPLYGKLAALQRKLAHFDLNLAAGFGAVSVTRPNETRTGSEDVITPEFVYGGGVEFYASDHVVLRLAGRGYIYSGPRRYKNTETGERVVSAPPREENREELNFVQKLEFPSEFLLGVSYMF